MFKSLLLFSAATLLAFAPSASLCATPQETAPAAPAAGTKNPVKPTTEGLAKAKATYQIDCAMCHGDNGDGKTDLAVGSALPLVPRRPETQCQGRRRQPGKPQPPTCPCHVALWLATAA